VYSSSPLPKDLTECSFHVLVNIWTLVSGLFLFTFSKNTNSLLDIVSFIISCFHLKIVLAKFVHIVSIANNFSVTYNRTITSILYCGTQAVAYIIAMKCFEVSSYHGCLLSKTDICPFHFLLTLTSKGRFSKAIAKSASCLISSLMPIISTNLSIGLMKLWIFFFFYHHPSNIFYKKFHKPSNKQIMG